LPLPGLAAETTCGPVDRHNLLGLSDTADSDSLSGLAPVVAAVLRDGFMACDPRTFDPIVRPADGSRGWRTMKRLRLDPDRAAARVADPARILGLRHRNKTRLCAIDLDNHGDGSPVWTRDDPRILALIRMAEVAGCGATLAPSPRGLHLWLTLPAAVTIVAAHWSLAAISRRAGLDPERMELFPSLKTGDPEPDARRRSASNGIRLPGQAGTIDPDDPATDSLLIWQTLAFELRRTAAAHAVDPEPWEALLRVAAAMEAEWKRRNLAPVPTRCSRFRIAAPAVARRLAAIRWTGPGQSNRLLGELANIGNRAGCRTAEALAGFIEDHARLAPGFIAYASADTQRRLPRWSADWARCNLRNPPTPRQRCRAGADAGRNARLRRESFCAVLAAVHRAARQHGRKALDWSERKVAEWVGISRDTLRKLGFNWRARLLPLLFRRPSPHPAGSGTDPGIQGGGGGVCFKRENPYLQAVLGPVSRSIAPSPPPDPPPDPSLLPILPTAEPRRGGWLGSRDPARVAAERDELARWLAAAA
jgi:hypothetical protein